MPQFDFFIWFSLSLGTVVTFQFLYYIILYYILAPFADLQKTLIKLYSLIQAQQNLSATLLYEYLATIYFQGIKLKPCAYIITTVTAKKAVVSKVNLLNVNLKKPFIIARLKTIKHINFTKKDKFLKSIKNALAVSRFLLSTAKPKKILQPKLASNAAKKLPVNNIPLAKGKVKGSKKKS